MSTLRVLPITSKSQTLTSRGRALWVTALAALLLAACGPPGAPGATATPGRPLTGAASTPVPAAAAPTAAPPVAQPTATAPPVVVAQPTATPAPVAAVPTATAEPTPARVVEISLGDTFFQPADTAVPVGTRILWRNLGQEDHDVIEDRDTWISPILKPGHTYERVFDAPGRYSYLCDLHDNMTAVIVVAAQ